MPSLGESPSSTNGLPQGQEQVSSGSPGADRGTGAALSPQQPMEILPPAIDDFDAIINGEVKTFVNVSEEIGGLVAEQVDSRGEGEYEALVDG